jgi:hypothetical protein
VSEAVGFWKWTEKEGGREGRREEGLGKKVNHHDFSMQRERMHVPLRCRKFPT